MTPEAKPLGEGSQADVGGNADLENLLEGVLTGNRRALARALTIVENGGPEARWLLKRLHPRAGRAHIVGITGAPGVGKSTLVNALAREYRNRERRVAIVAVDPSSPFTGGALLGDRVRMRDLAGDTGVFIRSMASRGSLGGLARATGDVTTVLDAAGFEVILVETVGAGQVEVDIAKEAHTTIVIEVPGMGDEVQSIKAGLFEIADIFVVNKADYPNAERVELALKMMLDMSKPREGWRPPILKTVATRYEGIAELADTIEAHRAHLQATTGWHRRVHQRAQEEFYRILRRQLVENLFASLPPGRFEEMLDRIVAREIDPYTAAQELIAESERGE